MQTLLKTSNKLSAILILGISSTFSVFLSVMRIIYTDSPVFKFMNWNLFLAFLPWATLQLFYLFPKTQGIKLIKVPILLLWLLFLPNAPYILTDLIHVGRSSYTFVWYDMFLVLSFSFSGLLFGFMSLLDFKDIISKYRKPFTVKLLISGIIFLSSFGVYLGRVLRWNSWDIINQPLEILTDVLQRFTQPLSYPNTWVFTIIFGIVLNLIFWSAISIKFEKA